MNKKTRIIVCVAVVLCIALAAGAAFAAPQWSGEHHSQAADTGTAAQKAASPQKQYTHADCSRTDDASVSCTNEEGSHDQDCLSEDPSHMNGENCAKEDCPSHGEHAQAGTGSSHCDNTDESHTGSGHNSGNHGGHHDGRHH